MPITEEEIIQSEGESSSLNFYLSGDWTFAHWLNKELEAFSTTQCLKENYSQLIQYQSKIEGLMAKVEIAEIRQENRFDCIIKELDDLAIDQGPKLEGIKGISGTNDDADSDNVEGPSQSPSITRLLEWIIKVEQERDSLINSYGRENFNRLSKLVKDKRILRRLLDLIPIEIEWRRTVSQMESCLESLDVDNAQVNLEQLEQLVSQTGSTKHTATLRDLRRRLVTLIKNSL